MRIEKSSRIRKSYIMGVVVIMIILQVILIYGVILGMVYHVRNGSPNEVTVAQKESSSVFNNNFLTQNSEIGIEVGRVTLIGILMVGTGLLLSIKEKDSEEKPEESTYFKKVEDKR